MVFLLISLETKLFIFNNLIFSFNRYYKLKYLNRMPSNYLIRSRQIAHYFTKTFDIPQRMRNILIVAGLTGVVLVFMESIIGGKPQTIEADKIIHFTGYALVAMVFVLGLRPVFFIPAMALLAIMGVGIEYIQASQGRSSEVGDMIANSVGISFGMAVGIIIRVIYGYLRKELAVAHVRKNILSYRPGDTILIQGQKIDKYYIIKKGKVRLTRKEGGKEGQIAVLGPGKIFGTLGIVLKQRQYSTVVAVEDSEIYGMNEQELIESAGGSDQPISLLVKQSAEYIVELHGKLNE